MGNDVIRQRLLEKFEAPLPEFYPRRIVFWHDEEQSFGNIIDEIDIPNVKVLKLTGNNNFYAKKLLSMEDTTSNYLVYDPCTYGNEEYYGGSGIRNIYGYRKQSYTC